MVKRQSDRPSPAYEGVTAILRDAPTKRAAVELQFSDEAMALARERGGVMALDFIPPLG